MFNIEESEWEPLKIDRKTPQYNPGVFEWNHFKAQTDPAYLLCLLKAVVEDISIDEATFTFEIIPGPKYEARIT